MRCLQGQSYAKGRTATAAIAVLVDQGSAVGFDDQLTEWQADTAAAYFGGLAEFEHLGASFRRHARFPSEGVAAPSFIPGVDWSDHRSFWEQGYPALMVTDTAPYRYPYYHTMQDTPDRVDYERLARVVTGLHGMLRDIARTE